MIISHKHKLVFVTTPKCGSHTGFKLMEDYLGGKAKGFNHNTVIPAECKDYFAFTFVRNPYERFCALHHSCVVNPGHRKGYIPNSARGSKIAYAKWLSGLALKNSYPRKDLCAPQWRWHEKSEINQFIQIERAEGIFQRSFPALKIKMPHELRREHLTWNEVKTPRLAQYIQDWAHKDFELGGYAYETDFSQTAELD